MAERLKRVVIFSNALGQIFFKWKMLSLSGPNALLFLQLLSALITMSVPSPLVSFWSTSLLIGFCLKKCMPSFELIVELGG